MDWVSRNGAAIAHGTHTELAAWVRDTIGTVDLLCFDAPYSAKTHRGHDTVAKEMVDTSKRKKLDYAAWGQSDVDLFCDSWVPLTAGWFVTITDTVLAPVWTAALERHDRYTFSPLALVEPGSRVRAQGDGPSQWSTWIVVARPRSRRWARWGTLPGAYVVPPGFQASKAVMGGKPLWAMTRIVEDYSRKGDVVCDPTCGGGTTLRAARDLGRYAIGCDVDLDHAKLAAKACRVAQPSLF